MIKKEDKILYEALKEKGLISDSALDLLLKEVDASGKSLQQILNSHNLLSEKDILKVLAAKSKTDFLDLGGIAVDKSVLEKVPAKIASYYKFLPVKLKRRVLTIAVSFPLTVKIEDEIRTQVGYDLAVVFACADDIWQALQKHYGEVAETLEGIVSHQAPAAAGPSSKGEDKVEDIEKLADDASVIKLVNQIILEGFKKRATDIHIEPYRGRVVLRYRIDGLLSDANVLPGIENFLSAIISRIKIMSNLNIVERRLPQDGRAVVKVQEQVLDLRISTVPTPFGESVVIRILPTERLFSLEKLGLSKTNLNIFEQLVHKPYGIIFVTGPTGSGKTTTLYACLNKINTKDRKIITIEDPIEYEMMGITQMQVLPHIGLDFARSLRSILRHDPDVIMVGEVRDLETAEIAIRVALTGHLIFSTLHTNDAASGITRLVDIGVEPYLVASSVEVFVAQRLIRLICSDCKYEDKNLLPEIRDEIAKDLGIKAKDIRTFKGKGCAKCNSTGFFGRTAIYEILIVDEEIKDLILSKASASQIKRAAKAKGMRLLREDGWHKVLAGLSTVDEVRQVTPLPDEDGQGAGFRVPLSPARAAPGRHQFLGAGRRVYKRLDQRIPVRYKVFESEAQLRREGIDREELSISKNISAGGVLFVLDKVLMPGVIVELHIELPDNSEVISCLARVVRTEEVEPDKVYDIAVCFLAITSAQRARLDKYIESK